MNDIEILKERKMCSMCTDCSDEICFNCKRVNGATLKEIESAFDAAIQALQAQAERDNPPPLTLEQLNQRVGKPVWCSRNKQYGIISKSEDEFQIWFCDGCESLEVFISKPIYDHEPKEINTK